MPVPANRVRIIAGSLRGRVVRFAPAPGLRPTPDRVRETLFNWLGQDLGGRRTLELYAGTGVLSLESVSRGAAHAVAVDRTRVVAEQLRRTATELGIGGRVDVHTAEASAFLARDTARYDVIYLDPPFAEDPWTWLLPACAAHLAPGGLVYAEAARRLAAAPGWFVHREARAGQVHYHLLARAAEAALGCDGSE